MSEADLREAQEYYYSAGGFPSQFMRPREAPWFWRRAAKLWREQAEELIRRYEGDKRSVVLLEEEWDDGPFLVGVYGVFTGPGNAEIWSREQSAEIRQEEPPLKWTTLPLKNAREGVQ